MIYFDNAAATPIDSELLRVYNHALTDLYANPSSPHALGRKSMRLFESINEKTLKLLNLSSKKYEVIHTSGASEANNLAIVGYAIRNKKKGNHLIYLETDHPSVTEAHEYLKKAHDFDVSVLHLLPNGNVNVNELVSLLRDDTLLISIGLVNSETGFITNLKLVKDTIRQLSKALLHVDLVQAYGHLNLPSLDDIDFMTLSLHKLNGPKCHGLLIKTKKALLSPILHGGGQQENYRSGTIDLPGAITMFKALEIAKQKEIDTRMDVWKLNLTLKTFLTNYPDLFLLNSLDTSSLYIVNFSLKKHKASVVIEALSEKEIYVSSTSACASSANKPSTTLTALSLNERLATNAIRVSFGYQNTFEEVMVFSKVLLHILKEIPISE